MRVFRMRPAFLLLLMACVILGALPILAAGPLRVRMYNGNTAPGINTIFPWFKITNTGPAPVELAGVKIRYYYTIDGERPQNYWCDWSSIGAQNVAGTFVKLNPPFSGADHYFELGFRPGVGSIQPGQSVEIHLRLAKDNWSDYNQTNDHSFNPTAKTYVDWDKITVHYGSNAITTTHDYPQDGQWVNRPASIQLTASGGSGVLTTCYRIDDGPPATGDLIQLDRDGAYTVHYWSFDSYGNSESPKTIAVKLDLTAPVVTPSLSPAPNAHGWCKTDVTVSFTAADPLSGVKSVASPATVTTEGAGRIVTGAATDNAGNTGEASAGVNLDKTPPAVANLQPAAGHWLNTTRPVISGAFTDALAGADPSAVALLLDGVRVTAGLQATSAGFQYIPAADLSAGPHTVKVEVRDLAGNESAQAITSFTIDPSMPAIPPDPAQVAPALDPTICVDLATATSFLYTGDNPIQTGVAEGTIVPQRAAVLRGRVLGRNGQPLPGTVISVHGHSEYGQTITRQDGLFDLAVNGGGPLTVRYDRAGYLPAQRQVNVPWQDYAWLPDVVLIQLDPQVTAVDLDTPGGQVARGSAVTDEDGTRQATLYFPEGTRALGLGTTIHVRATEFTVGENGPLAMPAELPPTTGYTYCVELTADEAGGGTVTFDQSVSFYLENFLNFPVGMQVPAGYYDHAQAAWIPSNDGRVIRILGADGTGLAELDVDGSGAAADEEDLAKIGITDAERKHLAGLYQSGQSIWRVQVVHFSPFDCNWGISAQAGAENPSQVAPQGSGCKLDDPCGDPGGSSIDIQNQILSETIGLTGTPMTLKYASDRVPGYITGRVTGRATGEAVPSVLKRVEITCKLAGRTFKQTLPALPNQSYEILWDGRDAYGRLLQGGQTAIVRIGYVYDGYYNQPAPQSRSFGLSSGIVISNVPSRTEVTLWQETVTTAGIIGGWDAKAQGLGGWTLDVHHVYDPTGRVLYLGDGTRRSANNITLAMETVAVGTIPPVWPCIVGPSVDGAAANTSGEVLGWGFGLAASPDGAFYVTDPAEDWETIYYTVRRIAPDGTISIIAGTGERGFGGDGGPATQALFNFPKGIALGKDGSLYIADCYNHRIRRIGPDGIITTIAGTGEPGFSGDGGPASQAQLDHPEYLAIGPDGSIYLTDAENARIRRIGPDGIITTVAGTGQRGYSGDGGPATQAMLGYLGGVAVGPDGAIYIADAGNHRLRRVGPDGVITTIAGTGENGYGGDGGPAKAAVLGWVAAIAVGRDGALYFGDAYDDKCRLRRIGTDGIITSAAGGGDDSSYAYLGPAPGAGLGSISGIATGADGCLYLCDGNVRRIKLVLPGFAVDQIAIPSEDGALIYRFSQSGRHLETINTLTGTVIYAFRYNGAGLLTEIEDGDGNTTTIERDAAGNPKAIVGPYGQRTVLELNAEGYLRAVTNPAGEAVRMTYREGGLLATFTDARNGEHKFTYDAYGRLLKDEDPAGGCTTLSRTDDPDGRGYTVTRTEKIDADAANVTTYRVEELSTGGRRTINSGCCGGPTISVIGADGRMTITYPDGTVVVTETGPDPRFGMQAPITQSMTVATPSGLTYTRTAAREAAYDEDGSLVSITDTITINGRTHTSVYDAVTHTITSITPEGRQSIMTLDEKDRVILVEVPGLASVNFEYDERGRLATITEGTGAEARVSRINYNAQGYISSTIDPLNRTTSFEYDDAGRVVTEILPDGRRIPYTYDANGNIVSITPSSKPAHSFTYTPVDQEETYNPPPVAGGGTNQTSYEYDLNRQPVLIRRPDGLTIGFEYDTAGRLVTLTIPSGEIAYVYDTISGNLTDIVAPDGGALSFSYNGSLLTKATWAGAVNGSIAYGYDNDFRLTSLTVNDADPVVYHYDGDGLLVKAGELILENDPDNGLLLGTSLGGVTDFYGYTEFGEVMEYAAQFDGTTLYSATQELDKLGRIISKTETVAGATHIYAYSYDLAGRLTDVYKDGVHVSHYTYDDNGNRLSHTTPDGTTSGTYDEQDRLLTYDGATYEYTANGELLRKTDANGTTHYDYDVLGNLLSVTLPDGTRIEYIIDGQNRRVGKKVNGSLVQGFLYQDDLKPIAELNSEGDVISRFVYAIGANVPDCIIKGGETYKIVCDHLGSPKLVVNTVTGQIVQRIDYDEYGNVLLDTNPGFQPFGFAGGIYDRNTKLVRFGTRDYSPETGRFMTVDPAGDGLNWYEYCRSNPIVYVDPDGMKTDVWGLPIPKPQNVLKDLARGVTVAGAVKVVLWVGVPMGIVVFIDFCPPEVAPKAEVCERKQVFKKYPTRKRAKDAKDRRGSDQNKRGKTKGPERHKNGPPHFHDRFHNDPTKPNIHYIFPR